MYIAIDSSKQLTYTGTLSGSHQAVNGLFNKFEQIFKDNGIAGKYHWGKLSSKKRNKLRKPLIKALSESLIFK